MAKSAKRLVTAQGLDGTIEVIQGVIESVEIPEKVDIIISEWMVRLRRALAGCWVVLACVCTGKAADGSWPCGRCAPCEGLLPASRVDVGQRLGGTRPLPEAWRSAVSVACAHVPGAHPQQPVVRTAVACRDICLGEAVPAYLLSWCRACAAVSGTATSRPAWRAGQSSSTR